MVGSSCSPTKYLSGDQILVKSTNVSFENPKQVNHKPQLKAELQLLAKPIPDYGFGGFNLWVYNSLRKVKKEKGFRNWLKKTFGRAPQYYEPTITNRSKLVLEKYLKDNGYFGSTVQIDTVVKKQQMTINYRVISNGQFEFATLHYPQDTTPVGKLINENRQKTEIDTTKYYSKLALDAERARLSQIVGKQGYMDFRENYIFYLVDTMTERLKADIYLEIENPSDSALHLPYHIGNTYAYPAYLLDDTLTMQKLDTIFRPNLMTIQPLEVVKPKTLDRAISQEKGDLVNRDLQDVSVSHLLDLGIFKFVRLKYERRDSGGLQILDRHFYLTPSLTQNVQYEFQINNRSGSYLGSAASIQYSHNNLFQGAERFNIKLSGGFETQLQNRQSFINTVDLTLEANLLIPKLLLPFKFRNRYFRFVPRTRVTLSNNFQRRTGFYTINSTNLKLGYEWQQNEKVRHQLTVVRLNQLDVQNKSDSFNITLQNNPRLNNSFQDVFIVGTNYTYTYNSPRESDVSPYYYFKTEIGTSGNLISLFTTAEKQDMFLGRGLARFLKFSPDFRYYIPRKNGGFASRILFGIGIPFGESKELPYIEQFFVGGSNSIRSFNLRGLGPGSYVNEEMMTNNPFLLDQTGDIKLEFNLEYRFDIIQYLEGAVFLDGGNIWLLNDNANERPTGVFKFDQFYKEIALGTGLGLRLDFDFFVIRLDTAFPIRKPITNGNFGWTFDNLSIYKRSWRRENLVYNLAIGYPF